MRAAAKIARGSYGGVSVDVRRARRASSLGERATAPARGVESVAEPDERVVELAGGAVAARVQLAAAARARRRARCRRRGTTKSSTPRATPCHCSPSAARLMSFSSVTVEPEPLAQLARRGRALERRKWVRVEPARPASTTPGTPTTAPSIRSRDGPGRLDRATRCTAAIAASAESASAPASSTSWRARTSPARSQTAPRSEPRAEVEPEHERGVGDRLEEDGAEARAGRIVLGLAHEARRDERLQRERDGRLRDPDAPRDLGARDRRVGAHRLEHGALVQVLEQRRSRAGRRLGVIWSRNPNVKRRQYSDS